ncbi:uncharacterized protein EV420DRAFT_1483168 [Desarmillaria tabescens]|uniref:Uncharacterized protein n=1 Tax=Armillaria tabescens TaxID=1929756 RepID=A0AA39JXI8_ARMTA|nr:uncharacterized protein EV420DRAFT_1483168 [Desarmillaria tabescens]KAK0449651.1 hypothetical protein EV420DRAFT_1483168 [Desarmillaria tabescens]
MVRALELIQTFDATAPDYSVTEECPTSPRLYSVDHCTIKVGLSLAYHWLPPLEDREIPEFNLQYPDSPTIPGYPDLSIATGRSDTVTRGGSPGPDPRDISDCDPRDTSGPDSYDSWVTDDGRHNPHPIRVELADHHLSPYGECHGDLCHQLQAIAEDRRRDWETPEPLIPYVKWTMGEYGAKPELAQFFFDNPIHSETSPGEYEIRTEPSPEGEVPTYQKDRNSPYYHRPKTSPSISGLEILRPTSGTAGTHGSTLPSPTTDTGSRSQTQRNPCPIPNQPPNPIMKKAVTEMDWEELLEWQGGSLANEGSWITTDAAKLMYQQQLPEMVRNAIYEDEVRYHVAKLWNQLHNDQADVLQPFEQRSYPPYHWVIIPKEPKATLPPGSRLLGGMPAEEAVPGGEEWTDPAQPPSQHAKVL